MELLGQLANHSAAVVHDEIELVVQGIREKVTAVRSGVLTVATGVVIGVAGVHVTLRCIDHRAQFLHGPGHGGACHRSGARL